MSDFTRGQADLPSQLARLAEYPATHAHDHIYTSFMAEAVLSGLLAEYSARREGIIATDPNSPWYPTVMGWVRQLSMGTSGVARNVSNDKARTASALRSAGLPVLEHIEAGHGDAAAAKAFGDEQGWPVVIKPTEGMGGRGVITGIMAAEIETAVGSLDPDERYLVQRQAFGPEYRLYATRRAMIAALCRVPGHVVGDGRSTILQLVDLKNESRRQHPGLRNRLIDTQAAEFRLALQAQASAVESVPAAGEVVRVAFAGNISSGGHAVAVTEDVHESIAEMAVEAVRAMPDRPYAGVDVILEQGHRVAASDQSVTILEVNNPGRQQGHLYPSYGKPVNVVREIVEDAMLTAGIPALPERRDLELHVSVFGSREVVESACRLMVGSAGGRDVRTVAQRTKSRTVSVRVQAPKLERFRSELTRSPLRSYVMCRADALSEARRRDLDVLGEHVRLPKWFQS